jgi:hypothetical protein
MTAEDIHSRHNQNPMANAVEPLDDLVTMYSPYHNREVDARQVGSAASWNGALIDKSSIFI